MARVKVSEPVQKEFLIEVALGNVDGYSADLVIAVTPNQQQVDGFRTIWDLDVPRTKLTSDTTLFISSSNSSDTDIDVNIIGLDGNLVRKQVNFNTNGQNGVNIGNFRFVYNVSISNTTPLGDLYVGTESSPTSGIPADANVVSKVIQGQNITHNGFYMIPKATIGLITGERFSTNSKDKSAIIRHEITLPGGFPTVQTVFHSVDGSGNNFSFASPVASAETLGVLSATFPPGAEIEWFSNVAENNTSVFFGADFLLVEISLSTLKD